MAAVVQVCEVDERDSGWEDPRPRFRVYLFSGPGDGITSYTTWTYDLTGTDVLGAIRWAEAEAGEDRKYAVALVVDRQPDQPDPGRGLVWLVGSDLNDA